MTDTLQRPADPDAHDTTVHHARHLVAGERPDPLDAPVLERRDPATGDPTSTAPVGDDVTVAAAVAAARAAAPDWARTPAAERAAALARAADAVEAVAEQLAEDSRLDMGRPPALARDGVAAGVATMREYAVLGPLHRGRRLNGSPDAWDVMELRPRGVAAVVTAWNDPVAATVGLLAAALVTGNTVVWKPSERAVRTSDRLAGLLAASFPPGVVNVVHGDATTGALLVEQHVDVVAHVGSTAAGRAIAAAAARTGAHTLLENGGKDPLVVDRGLDPQWVAQQIALGGLINSGQLCTAVERVYVHTDAYDAVREALLTEVERWAPGGEQAIGPLVDTAHRDAVHAHVSAARDAGARVLRGGEVADGPGAFYPPTVLEDVPADAAVLTEETFGPVLPLVRVEDVDEGLRLAGAGRYGLAATVLTADLVVARRACTALDVGTVKVNDVFGGAPGGAATPRRGSGTGLGYGPELLDEMTAVTVCHLGPPRAAAPSPAAS
ncbi:aldehyde dehydrogenase family protein [Aquipuribacter nitratireducens]|uniref:Aldehyde dehydrogenase family protein n=1 Tax=Aquipuribacter nitratireducens TaxID=650104 RepID=A0ABW0GLV7_9MICO